MEIPCCMVELDASNYWIWKRRMEDLLYVQDLHDPIVGAEARPKDMSDAEWELMNRKTAALIRQFINDRACLQVAEETNAKSLWEKLASLYERKTPADKIRLFKKLMELRYEDGKCMRNYVNDFMRIVAELTSMDVSFSDELKVYMLLASLPESWNLSVTALINSVPEGELSLITVMRRLFDEELRRKMFAQTGPVEVLTDHDSNFGSSTKSRDRSKARKEVTCFKCGMRGHYRKECWRGLRG